MVTFCDWPGSFTTSIPLSVTVKVWAEDPTFATVMLSPDFTLKVAGENTNPPPGPCWRVVPAALGEPLAGGVVVGGCVPVGVLEGVELVPHAAPSIPRTTANRMTNLAPRRPMFMTRRSFKI